MSETAHNIDDPLEPYIIIAANLDAAAAERELAFKAIVEATYEPTLHLALVPTRNEADAEDIAQETFLRVWRALPRFRGDAKFTSWLHTITRNETNNQLNRRTRRQNREIHVGTEENGAAYSDTSQQDILEQVEDDITQIPLRQELHDALGKLTVRSRTAVIMRDVHQMSHKEIAARLETSEGAAKLLIHRGRIKLRKIYFGEQETEET